MPKYSQSSGSVRKPHPSAGDPRCATEEEFHTFSPCKTAWMHIEDLQHEVESVSENYAERHTIAQVLLIAERFRIDLADEVDRKWLVWKKPTRDAEA